MRLDDRPADPQAHAHASRLGGIKGSNSRSMLCGSSPIPKYCTATSTVPDLSGRDRISNSRGPSAAASIASMLFIAKFSITCWSCTRSPRTGGRPAARAVRTETRCRRASLLVITESFLNGFAEVQPRHAPGPISLPARVSACHLARAVPIIDDAADRFPEPPADLVVGNRASAARHQRL